ncbi:hypothetical protein BOX37_04480 [Nocardia mangyaensis]|uniref:DUF4349 domain-containing protein n=2 Tax=Nocardia mangyaensis TaxID=2213200 RepID=A0A1J0W1G5_9NOCA|nr:hypothetical protein BOX37_04480 [Nocardia mangyaensis]
MMRKLAVVMIGLLGLLFVAGCGGVDSENTGASVPTMSPPVAAEAPGFREGAPPKDSPAPANSDRKEVITGSIDVSAEDPIAAAATVTDQVNAVDGRIDSRTEQPGTDKRTARAVLSVRVPADKTDAFVTGLGGVGTVTRVSTNRDDVTMQWQDLDARIRALQSSVDRLRALMAGAANTADLIAAEEALASRQGELDSLTAQKRSLDDQVALSTLTITLTADEDRAPGDPDNFWDGIVSGWHSLVDWLKDAVVFAGKAVPWLGFLAVIGAVLWALVRLVRGRGRKTGAAVSAPTALATKPDTGAEGKHSVGEDPKGADSADGAGDDQAEQP